jgi:hypothetical protein
MPTNPVEERIRAEREKSQTALVVFLTTDLNLAHTFLGIAQTKINSDPDHSRFASAKARDALRTIRRFQSHIEDPAASANIRSRADALESSLKSFAV